VASREENEAKAAPPESPKKSRIGPVRFRGVTVRIYRKTKSFPYYRIAYRADGKRVVRAFKEYKVAKTAAEARARELYDGNHLGASLPKSAAVAYQFAIAKLRDFCFESNSRRPDGTPELHLSLENVIAEYIEAKRKLGFDVSLVKTADAYVSNAVNVRRISLQLASEEFLGEREARTRPEKEGARPKLSSRMYYQDGLRLGRFRDAFQMDVCDLRPAHLDLFFAEHLKDVMARTRNHFRSTLSVFIKWCVRKSYLPEIHALWKSEGLRPDGKGKEDADVGDVEVYSAKEFGSLLANAQGPLHALVAIGGLAGIRTEELLRFTWRDLWRREGYIEVSGRKSKTRSRRLIPINFALAAWLEPFRQHTSDEPIWPGKFVSFHERVRELHAKANVPRRANPMNSRVAATLHTFDETQLRQLHQRTTHGGGIQPTNACHGLDARVAITCLIIAASCDVTVEPELRRAQAELVKFRVNEDCGQELSRLLFGLVSTGVRHAKADY